MGAALRTPPKKSRARPRRANIGPPSAGRARSDRLRTSRRQAGGAAHMLARRAAASAAQAAHAAGSGPGGCSRRCTKPAVRRMLRSSTVSAGAGERGAPAASRRVRRSAGCQRGWFALSGLRRLSETRQTHGAEPLHGAMHMQPRHRPAAAQCLPHRLARLRRRPAAPPRSPPAPPRRRPSM